MNGTMAAHAGPARDVAGLVDRRRARDGARSQRARPRARRGRRAALCRRRRAGDRAGLRPAACQRLRPGRLSTPSRSSRATCPPSSAGGRERWCPSTDPPAGQPPGTRVSAEAACRASMPRRAAASDWGRCTCRARPPHPHRTASSTRSTKANFNNHGERVVGGLHRLWRASPSSRITFGAFGARTRLDVPNDAEQQQAGQRQVQALDDENFSLAWQQTASPRIVTDVAAYHRRSASQLAGGVMGRAHRRAIRSHPCQDGRPRIESALATVPGRHFS